MARTPNLQLQKVLSSTSTIQELISFINENYDRLDAHNHGAGAGRAVPISALVSDSVLDMDGQSIINQLAATFRNLSSASLNRSALYVKNGDLYFRDEAGREIQITKQGSIDARSLGLGSGTEIDKDVFMVNAASSQQITNPAGGRAFSNIKAFTAPASVKTGVTMDAKGIRINETGIYSLDLQFSLELISSIEGEWGISLIRSNGLTGNDEVIHQSSVFSNHTDALTGADEDFIEQVQFPISKFDEGDYIYVAVSFGASAIGALTFNISPSPTTSELVIRRYRNQPSGINNSFLGLRDTPNTYSGKRGQIMIVNDEETAQRFASVAEVLGGAVGQTFYYGIHELSPRNDANKIISRNSVSLQPLITNDFTTDTNRFTKMVRSLLLGGAMLDFNSDSTEGYYVPWVAIAQDSVNNLIFRDENDLWRQQGTAVLNGITYNLYIRTLPLLNNKTLRVFIKDYE